MQSSEIFTRRIKKIKEKDIGKLPDVELSAEEIEAARNLGLAEPEAGLPDHDAIRDAFGLEVEDLSLGKAKKPFIGKHHRVLIDQDLDRGVSDGGRHDQSGADTD
jgi:hypothetical protein